MFGRDLPTTGCYRQTPPGAAQSSFTQTRTSAIQALERQTRPGAAQRTSISAAHTLIDRQYMCSTSCCIVGHTPPDTAQAAVEQINLGEAQAAVAIHLMGQYKLL